jgi:hypothetical protein
LPDTGLMNRGLPTCAAGPYRRWQIPPLSWADIFSAVRAGRAADRRKTVPEGAVRARRSGLCQRDSQKRCYCENVKNITVSVPDDVYRSARVAAAQRDTSVSALVVKYLERLSGRMDEFARLEALQREVQAEIGQFRAADQLSRDEVHDRAVR